MPAGKQNDRPVQEDQLFSAYPAALRLLALLAGCQTYGQVQRRTDGNRSAIHHWWSGRRAPRLDLLIRHLHRLGRYSLVDLEAAREFAANPSPTPAVLAAARATAARGIRAIAEDQATNNTKAKPRPRGPQPDPVPDAGGLEPADWLKTCLDRLNRSSRSGSM